MKQFPRFLAIATALAVSTAAATSNAAEKAPAKAPDGKPIPGSGLSDTDRKAIVAKLLEVCDARDGARLLGLRVGERRKEAVQAVARRIVNRYGWFFGVDGHERSSALAGDVIASRALASGDGAV